MSYVPDVATSKTVVARIRFARSRLDVAKRMPAIPGLDVARSGPYDAKPGPDVANRIRSGPDLARIWPKPYCLNRHRSGPELARIWPRTILPELAQVWPRSYCMIWARPGPVQAVWSWARSGPALGQTCACSGSMVWARSGPDLGLIRQYSLGQIRAIPGPDQGQTAQGPGRMWPRSGPHGPDVVNQIRARPGLDQAV